jgi:hypothetical protein
MTDAQIPLIRRQSMRFGASNSLATIVRSCPVKLLLAGILSAIALLIDVPAIAQADPDQCDVYHRTCYPQYCYGTGGWTSPYSGYCPDTLGPPYGRGNGRDAG